MSSDFRQALAALVVVVTGCVAMDYAVMRSYATADDETVSREPVRRVPVEGFSAERAELRVCADPNNMPYSNHRREGFENALAELVAHDLGLRVSYAWWPQRRGFVRNTLAAGKCDVMMGVPAGYELAEPTRSYYRSTYVFVTRAADNLRIRSFEDPRLQKRVIGVHAIGDDYNNVPPAQMLAAHGLVGNVRGYSIYGDYSQPDPPRALIDAVARGEIDVAIAWGPLAGYFASREAVPLTIQPVEEGTTASPAVPMQFDIAMAVRRDDRSLAAALESVISRRQADIEALLMRYGVPLVPRDSAMRVASHEE